ncbi:T9SS type A sorting domain-containing protein [Hymenobacter taeanensis]|uniref:T9SS type A sorting domain-containing protein n=1 Tax=Hymenobacter taeanensis TaxID=2735321 RepID=A0A6M6BK54_9BACT|nr:MULTISPECIES: T9SS type A sorting domain-containing protein [Hymenobacter]QJX47713.1 T9SS type A sorting domain-containing protein [Hymenobacter taeanensis]UOQ82802.1 T9SS type A sorting domain-containing protein [Hymenobacter sp. 5414T-23]
MQTTSCKSLGLLLVALLTSLSTWAQSGQNTQGQAKPTRRAVLAYVQQNVLPVVRQQRQKLEPQLSTSDKAQLAIYRTQLQELRQRGKALRQSFRTAGTAQGTRPELTETQKQELQKLRTDQKALMQEVGKLGQKYEGDIARLAQEIQPQREKWSADLKNLVVQNAKPEQQERRKHLGGKIRHNNPTTQYFRPAMFLLMKADAPATSATASAGSAVYPNPVAPTSQLEYEVKKAGPVTIDLLDSKGNTVRNVAREANKEKGTYTLPVSLSDLTNGTYYFKITTKGSAETKRFVKE